MKIFLWMILLTGLVTIDCSKPSAKRPNVLFLVSDDLRPELGCYNGPDAPAPVHPSMHTPNLDKLAARSLLLKRAYVQEALCAPSRASFLTARRPDTTHVYQGVPYWRIVGGNFTTLPQYFKQNGYITAGLGKVFHPGNASGGDDPISWTEPYYHAPNYELWRYNGHTGNTSTASWMSIPYTVQQAIPLPDQQIAANAVQKLKKLTIEDKPFFLAVGFHKPHLPFVFPAEFIKHYPQEVIQLPLNPYAPVEMPPIAWHNYIKGCHIGHFSDIHFSNYSGNFNTSMSKTTVLELRRAYYSAVSYIDYLVGKLIDTVDELGIAKDTIISFMGDHGWQLGEHGEWCKQTNFELATRIPMMVHIPGKTDQGIQSEKLTEAVDLFPTIAEAAGLPSIPLCAEGKSAKTELCREGRSLLPLISNATTPWKTAVFSQYPRKIVVTEENAEADVDVSKGPPVMGYTVRTDGYRFTEWARFSEYKPDWSKLYGVELYDHTKDPQENINEVNNPTYKNIVVKMSSLLHGGWRNVPDQVN